MRLMGFAGWSGAGKTTLLVKVLPLLRARGLTVSTLKHAHHGFDIDKPGKDTYRHRQAGAREVMVASGRRWALMHELPGEDEPDLEALLARMAPVDLLLIEGFKSHHHDKIEVFRPSLGKPPLWPEDPYIVAVATDIPTDTAPAALLDIDDPGAVARFILARLEAASN